LPGSTLKMILAHPEASKSSTSLSSFEWHVLKVYKILQRPFFTGSPSNEVKDEDATSDVKFSASLSGILGLQGQQHITRTSKVECECELNGAGFKQLCFI
jgi:hypothetical protein